MSKRLITALEGMLDNFECDIPDRNCSCQISPPCGDCYEWSAKREAVENAREALNAARESAGDAQADPPQLWVCGQYRSAGRWEFQGVFAAEKMAVDACDDDSYFVAPVILGQVIGNRTEPWPGAYYPKAQAAAPDAPAAPQTTGGVEVEALIVEALEQSQPLAHGYPEARQRHADALQAARRLAARQPAQASEPVATAEDAGFKVGDRVEWVSGLGDVHHATVSRVVPQSYDLSLDGGGRTLFPVPASSLTRLTGGSHE